VFEGLTGSYEAYYNTAAIVYIKRCLVPAAPGHAKWSKNDEAIKCKTDFCVCFIVLYVFRGAGGREN